MSSCETLYTKSCGCSKEGFEDKFVRDPNKTPNSSQRPPHDCLKCGNPIDGLHCRQCALLRKKLKEVWFIIFDEHKVFQDFLNTFESSNDDSNVINMSQEPFVFNQNPGENSSQSPPYIDHHCCYGDDESFSDENIPKEIYSNPLFDEEMISIKIDPHHFNVKFDLIESLLNQYSSIISSSKIDSLLDEFADELIFHKSIPSGIDEVDCDFEKEIRLIEKLLYDNSSPRPSEEFNSKNSDVVIESFSPSPILVEDSDSLMEEIDLSLTLDDSMPSGIENDDYDSEGDILILEEFLSNDSLSLFENESFHFNIPSSHRPPTKPPDDDEIEPDSGSLTVKVVGDISEHYVLMPRLLSTQPTLASNKEKSHHLLSHRGFKAF
nr:hypothetical protein [Tanacetum cinerariifolium]